MKTELPKHSRLTEAAKLRACAVLLAPYLGAARTVREGRVLVPDVVEEMDLVLAREERGADAVDGCVAPTLLEWVSGASASMRMNGWLCGCAVVWLYAKGRQGLIVVAKGVLSGYGREQAPRAGIKK